MINKVKKPMIYLLANVISSMMPFLLMPVLLSYVSPGVYAELGIFQSLLFIFMSLVGLSASGYILRMSYDTEYDIACLIYSAFQLATIILVVIVAIVFFVEGIYELIGLRKDWLIVCIIVSYFNVIINIRLVLYQFSDQVKKYAVLQVLLACVNLIFSLLLIQYYTMPEDGRIIAILFSHMAVWSISIYSLKREGVLNFNKFYVDFDRLKELVKFGFPLLPHVFGIFLFTSLDKIILGKVVGYDFLGYYFVAFQVSSIYKILFDALNKVYTPYLFRFLSGQEGKEAIHIRNLMVISALIILSGIVGAKVIPIILPMFISEGYYNSLAFLNGFIVGHCFGGIYLLFVGYLFFYKKTWLISKITIFVGCVDILLLLYLLPKIGAVYASWIYAIIRFTQMLIVIFYSITVNNIRKLCA